MRQRLLVCLHIPIVFLLLVMILACTRTVKIQPASLQLNSPLKNLQSKSFLVKNFNDVRGVKENTIQGVGSCAAHRPIKEIVRTAITNELLRNGHRCVEQVKGDSADYIIEGSVYECGHSSTSIGFTTNRTIKVGLKLTVTRNDSRTTYFTKKYEGLSFKKDMGACSPSCISDMVNRALMNAVQDFSLDKEFIGYLKGG